jgi:hypothetical protein
MDSPRAWSRLSYTVLAQDPRFRDIPVAVIGEAPLDFADALRNIDQVAADPRRLVARMVCHWCECAPSRAISSKCSRACLLIRYCANQYCFAGVSNYQPRRPYCLISTNIDQSGGNFALEKRPCPAMAQSYSAISPARKSRPPLLRAAILFRRLVVRLTAAVQPGSYSCRWAVLR